MIGNRIEYQRMFEVEQKLWWYQILHEKVLAQIQKHFKKSPAGIRILDAACGTGGLLSFLRDKGYHNAVGFDYSQDAIDFSGDRGLDVSFGDLKNIEVFHPGETFDLITCNDALYFLSDQEIIRAFKAFKSKLNTGGLILINIHAFEAFSGTHDLAVGSQRRFTLPDFQKYCKAAGLQIGRHTYWPFALSLPILAVRQWQKFQIKRNKLHVEEVDSDVAYPGDLINGLLKTVTKAESGILPIAPFGSSLFMAIKI